MRILVVRESTKADEQRLIGLFNTFDSSGVSV